MLPNSQCVPSWLIKFIRRCFNVVCPLGRVTASLTVIWCIFRPWTGDKLPVPEKHRMKFSPAFYWDYVFISKGSLLWTESSRPPPFSNGSILIWNLSHWEHFLSDNNAYSYEGTDITVKHIRYFWSGLPLRKEAKISDQGIYFVCVEVLQPSQPNGVISSAVSLPNHTFTGQA